MPGSVAETTKQNIFIHEFIQPKHASNPQELTVQMAHRQEKDNFQFEAEGARLYYLSPSDHQQSGGTAWAYHLQTAGGQLLKGPGPQCHSSPHSAHPLPYLGHGWRTKALSALLLSTASLSRWVLA